MIVNEYSQIEDSVPGGEVQESLSVELYTTVYHDSGTGYFVGRFVTEDGESVTAVGDMVSPHEGETYILHGKWGAHPRYGKQFQFKSYDIDYPATETGLIEFLSSGLLQGVGRATARKIVKKFGTDAVEVLDNDIDSLLEIDGITKRKLETIRKSWERERAIHALWAILQPFDVGVGMALKIFQQYGTRSAEVVQENPYRLTEEVDGFTFPIADRIAAQTSADLQRASRMEACARYVLSEASRQNGHTYMPMADCVQKMTKMLGEEPEELESTLIDANERAAVVIEDDRAYLPYLYFAEHHVAAEIQRLAGIEGKVTLPDIPAAIAEAERQLGVAFHELQKRAVQSCFEQQLTLITGGPGTGKSTLISAIVLLAEQWGVELKLCAPTGRAAKRMEELTGKQATTIHRMLEYDPVAEVFKRNEELPLDCELLVVDEMSMVDLPLMAWLLSAVPSGARLVLVGDADQLPPVGPGDVLRDLVDSGMLPVHKLTEIFRQADGSGIVRNAHRIKEGHPPEYDTDFLFVRTQGAERMKANIMELVAERIPAEFGLDPLLDIQVLSPTHQTPTGVRELNAALQGALNAKGRVAARIQGMELRLGDKVMQTVNNYMKDVFNGDIGYVESHDSSEGSIEVAFGNQKVKYNIDELHQLTLAYATTVHKSQGSEYQVVVMPFSMQQRVMMYRNLLYTAVSRAKQLFIGVGQEEAFQLAVRSTRNVSRNSSLQDRLSKIFA